MSEQRPQNQNEELLDDDQYLEEDAELDVAEDRDEPAVVDRYVDVPSAADSPAEGITGRWKSDGPTQVDDVLSRSGSIFGDVSSIVRTTDSEKIRQDQRESGPSLSEVVSAREAQTSEVPERIIDPTIVENKADKGLGKGNRTPKPEEDIDAAREAVEKSLKSEKEATEEPTAEKRAEASAKISETAQAAARPVAKERRSKQDRKTRGQDASRGANARAEARGEAKRAAKAAKETKAPQTPPIMGERDGANEKPAKQTVVTEGSDGQQYITEPTTQPQERARIPKNAATEARPVPEAVIPTQEQSEPAAPAEEPKKILTGKILDYGSAERNAQEYQSLFADSADFLDMDLSSEAPAPVEGPKPKAPETAETQATQSREEQLDEDVLAAMGGADSGRPAKRGGGRKARRAEAAEASTPVEPVAEPETPRRPSPADMPGARKNSNGPSPANMPRRRPATHAVNEQAPAPEEPTPEAEKPAAPEATPAEDNEWGTFAPEVEYGNENYKLAFGSTTFAASYRAEKEYQDAGKGENEDNLLVDQENGLIGVYDGMGSNSGEEARAASAAAANAIKESWVTNIAQGDIDTVEDAVAVMRTAYDYARSEVQRTGGGTATAITAKVMEFDGERYLIYGHAGDARLVAYDPDTKSMIMGTEDQGTGHIIDNGLGKVTREWPRVQDEFGAIKLPKNARIMVCSDGITGDYDTDILTNEDLVKVFQDNEDATSSELAHAFIAASRKVDDKTVVVMDVFAKEAAQTAGETPSDAPEYEEEEVNDEVKRILKKYENGLDVADDEDDSSEPLSDAEAELLKTAGERDTRTPEEVEADDEAEAKAKEAKKAAVIADDTLGSMRNSALNRLGGFGDRSRSLGSMALGGEDDSWADGVFGDLDDESEDSPSPWDVFSREPLDDPLSVTRRGSGETEPTDDHENDDDDNNDDDDSGASRSLGDDLFGDADFEPARRNRRERVGAAFRTGWDKARTYFTGRDLDSSTPDRDRRIAGRQLKVMAGALGATVLAGALFSGLASDTGNEGPTHVGKGPSASAEKTPGAKVDSGKTEAKPSESATGSDKKESKKPSATVDDDHRHEHGTGTGNVSHTFDVGRETVKVSADNEVVVTLKQGGTVWDAIDKLGDELHINHSDEDIAETVQSMHLKPGQDRQMKVGSSYTFKVQGGKLVAKK